MYSDFDEESKKILLECINEKNITNKEFIGSEHFLLAILNSDCNIKKLLNNMGINYNNALKDFRTSKNRNKNFMWNIYTPLMKRVISNASIMGREKNTKITINNLFSNLIMEGDGLALRYLAANNVNINYLYQLLCHDTVNNDNELEYLNNFGVNLNEKVKNNDYNQIIGRDKEINDIIKILLKTKKRNPILIGKAGVGKTAIVEEFANRINKGLVPYSIQNIKIFMLSTSSLVAGTKYRGEFEERIELLLKEVKNNKNIVLFIDEVHTIIGAGGADGAIDAANILKPYLARGDISIIGATTEDEYNKYILKDKAFARRFTTIYIQEPNKNTLLEILKKYANNITEKSNINISNDCFAKIIDASNYYNSDSNEPDKSIDLLEDFISEQITNKFNKEGSTKLNAINDVKRQKEEFINKNEWDKAYKIRKKELSITSKINDKYLNSTTINITKNDLENYINNKLQIFPIKSQDEDKYLKKLNNKSFHKTVYKKIIDSLKESGIAVICGPKLSGKTYILKNIGKILFNNNYFFFDLALYDSHSVVNELIGMPRGYKESDKSTALISYIKYFPHGLICIDNFNLASKQVKKIFNDLINNHYIIDGCGNKYVSYNKILLTETVNKLKIGFNNSQITNELCTKSVNKNNTVYIAALSIQQQKYAIRQKEQESTSKILSR